MLLGHQVEKGMLVRFMADNASPFEIQWASEILKKGETYTVTDIFKDQWGCYIYLEGIPRKSFKCYMFSDAGSYVPEEEKRMPAAAKKK